MKDRSSKNITKYVDYVYLTVAAIGLLSASDYDLKKYNRSVEGLVYYAQSSLFGDKYRLEEYYRKSCVDPDLERCKNISNVISRINDASKFFNKEASNSTIKHPSTEVYNMGNYIESVLNAFKKVDAETVAEIGGLEAKYLQQSIDRYRIPPFGSGDMIHKEEGFERQFDVDGFKSLGYLLIAAALSLRISRVTVELRSWWNKNI